MIELLALVVSGAVTGALFAIMASGIVLTYQSSGTLNFAHGAIAFVTAYLFYQLNTGLHVPRWAAFVICVVLFAPGLGILLNRALFRRLATAPVYARIVGTIGIYVALPALAQFVVKQINHHGGSLPTTDNVYETPGLGPVPAERWTLFTGVVLDTDQIAVLVVAALTAAGLWLLLNRSRVGLAMRADVDRRELATLRGIDSARVSDLAWAVSSGLAGLGGVLISPLFGLGDTLYTLVVLGSLAAVVLAKFRSIPLALLGGLLLGVVANLVAGYADRVLPDVIAGLSGLRSAIPYLLTLIGLLVLARQQGRLGGLSTREVPPPDHRDGLPAWRRRLPWLVVVAGLVVFGLFVASPLWQNLLALGAVFAVIYLSFVVVTGMGGMVSLAQAMFVTTGAFVTGWLFNHQFPVGIAGLLSDGYLHEIPIIVLSALVAGAAGALIALPIRRLGALALALATLSLAFVADLLIFKVDAIRNTTAGWTVRAGSLGPLDFSDQRVMFVAALLLFGLVTWTITNLQRSASGRVIYAARSSDIAARTVGLSPDRTRVLTFAFSAAIAGLGGSLYILQAGSFTDSTTPPIAGLIWLVTIATLGIRRPAGALLAGFLTAAGTELLVALFGWTEGAEAFVGDHEFLAALLGLGAIGLAQNPDGAFALSAAHRRERRERRARKEETVAVAVATDLAVPVTPEAPVRAALRLRGIHAGYDGREVLRGVDLVLTAGRVVALVGPNGVGKTTLCNVAGGLVVPTTGTIEIDGVDVTGEPAFRRNTRGLFVAPEGRGIFPGLTVEENLAVRMRTAEQRAAAYERLPALRDRRGVRAGALSGGEQQMLALASALVSPPAVLLADEPTLGLAPKVAEQIFEAIVELREQGTAILLIQERAAEALRLADEVVMMAPGRVVWTGPRSEIDLDRIAEDYLAVRAPVNTVPAE
ncbi:ABC transporter permease subunit [Cryptosporangium aurantiacum]|uniref:ABC-type branched-chain amino acid transport system, ATPase component n=1 Tax=Cryptosporangium aurantiacum TaxID=134849 RepID=A0A1M7TYD5_9ACTN|nr:ATP-binding cassette domain-containing protein [Cryptosporangium aurantiacum]SHN75724.1 ABC-type branched-chain amino acid transport system, ATPase component [Cryptosporangium aurantiacum]